MANRLRELFMELEERRYNLPIQKGQYKDEIILVLNEKEFLALSTACMQSFSNEINTPYRYLHGKMMEQYLKQTQEELKMLIKYDILFEVQAIMDELFAEGQTYDSLHSAVDMIEDEKTQAAFLLAMGVLKDEL